MSDRLFRVPPIRSLVGGKTRASSKRKPTVASDVKTDEKLKTADPALKSIPWTLGTDNCYELKLNEVVRRLKTSPIPSKWIDVAQTSLDHACELAYQTNYWSTLPADQQQDIVQNSKYGVDFVSKIYELQRVKREKAAKIAKDLDNTRIQRLLDSGSYSHVIGPISLTEHYSPLLDMQIFIFGDWHIQIHKCANNEPQLDAQIRTTAVPLLKLLDHLLVADRSTKWTKDLFLEIDYLTQQFPMPKDWASMLGTIQRHYPKCFRCDKTHCAVKQSIARFHYTDVRRVVATPVFDLLNLDVFQPNTDDTVFNLDSIRHVLQVIEKHMTRPQKLQTMLSRLKITKQWDAIADAKIRDTIQTVVKADMLQRANGIVKFDYLSKIAQLEKQESPDVQMKLADEWKLPTMNDRSETPIRPVPLFVHDKYKLLTAHQRLGQQLLEQVAALHTLFLDAYLLGRLFRSFMGRTRQQPPYRTHRAIIVAGDEHCDYYRAMLQRLGFQSLRPRETDRPKVSWQCMSLSKPLNWLK